MRTPLVSESTALAGGQGYRISGHAKTATTVLARQRSCACRPQVLSAEDLSSYEILAKFTALLEDGHTRTLPPQSLYLSVDRPKLKLKKIENAQTVTNASSTIARCVSIGSKLLAVDDIPTLAARVMPLVFETIAHRRLEHAVPRLRWGLMQPVPPYAFHHIRHITVGRKISIITVVASEE